MNNQSGGGICHTLWYFQILLLIVTAVFASLNVRAYDDVKTVRIALPQSYETQNLTCNMFKNDDNSKNCAKFTMGNDYQVLEWLQNGKVDGAVVSSLMLDLLRRDYWEKKNGNEFSRHFIVLDEGDFNGLALQAHRYRLQATNQSLQTKEAFEQFLNELLTSSSSHNKRLYLPSHLSPALPQLFEYANKWLSNHSKAKNKDFWERFLNQIGFYIYNKKLESLKKSKAEIFIITAAENCSDNMQSICLGESASKDTLVLRRHAIPNYESENNNKPEGTQEPKINSSSIPSCTGIFASLDNILHTFCKNNYSREDAGTRWHYRFLFTIDEIWNILRHSTDYRNKDDKSKDDKSLALILTGGGVKAAYQTWLIDKFYEKCYLINSIKGLPASEKRDNTLPVKHVIGTSGGALLGMFVASIDKEENKPVRLTKALWETESGDRIDANDIFPSFDLMRWLSLVVCIIVFALVLTIYGPAQNLWQKFVQRGTAQQKKAIPTHVDSDANQWGWKLLSVCWMVLLLGSPLLIKLTHGNILEHIPAIEGIVYFLCSLIAIYSYNRVNITGDRRETKSNVSHVKMLLLMAVGIILTVIAIIITKYIKGDWFVSPLPPLLGWDFHITPTTLMACIGILLFFFATHLLFKRIYGYSQPKLINRSFAIITMVCLLTYILYIPIVWVGYGTWLEMTMLFWYWFIFLSIVVSFAVVYLAYGKYAPKTWQKCLQPYMDYLRSSDPSWRYWPFTRYGRLVLLFTVAWGWWNFVVAPGLYGNEQARSYLCTAYNRAMTGKYDTLKPCEQANERGLNLQTFFTAPVTALEKEKEYYVLFQPQQSGKESSQESFHSLLGYHNWLTVSKNPRWIAIDNQEEQNKLLLKVVFASGSPFPIFPATRINLPNIGEEWLVDGGYAHNIPIQAASQLGARRLLNISSSPREQKQVHSKESYLRGNLSHHLRRLIPYLYERSQVEDTLSAEDILVARLAPLADPEKPWPFLMDFRQEVVERMFKRAEEDFDQRIGEIESWGNP